MSDNIVSFVKRTPKVAEAAGDDRQAWVDYELWISIIKNNIELVKDSERAWMILQSSPFEFANKPYLFAYVCGYLESVLNKYLEDMDSKVRRDSYIGSYLVADLCTAFSMMDGDHLTTLTIWTEDQAITIKLSRTWENWHVTNLFFNGVSIWDLVIKELKDKGYTDHDLFHWKEQEETNDE